MFLEAFSLSSESLQLIGGGLSISQSFLCLIQNLFSILLPIGPHNTLPNAEEVPSLF